MRFSQQAAARTIEFGTPIADYRISEERPGRLKDNGVRIMALALGTFVVLIVLAIVVGIHVIWRERSV